MKRAVFFHERGEVRDRSFDSQAFRASGLNLVVSAIVHWNTFYFTRVVNFLKGRAGPFPVICSNTFHPSPGSISILQGLILGGPSRRIRPASDP